MEDVTVVVGAPAPDGRGTCTLSGPIDIPEEFLWERLIHKAYHFEEYFTTAELNLTVLPDGRLYRNMVIDDPVRAPKMGRRRVIDVFTVDKEAG